MKKKIFLIFLVLPLFLLAFTKPVKAADNLEPTNNFVVTPILSANQTNGIQSYFDIPWQPGGQNQLRLVIANKSQQTNTYRVRLTQAHTDNHGKIDYSTDGRLYRAQKLTKIVRLEQKKVTIGAKQQTTVIINVKFPNKNLHGLVVGGVTVSPVTKQKKSGITNVVSYTVPLALRRNKTRKTNLLKFSRATLKKQNNQSTQYKNQYSLILNAKNMTDNLLTNYKTNIKITRDSNQALVGSWKNPIDIAPNTYLALPLKLKKNIAPGKYTVKARIHKGKDNFTYTDHFTISRQQAKKIQETNNVKSTINYLAIILWVLVGVVIILIGTVIYLVRRNKKKIK